MPEKYLYNGKLMQQTDVAEAARLSKLDINTYIQKAGIKVVNDSYDLGGKKYSAEDVLDAAKKSNLGFDDYIQKAGFLNAEKKNPVSSDGGKVGNGNVPSESLESSQSGALAGLLSGVQDNAKVPVTNTKVLDTGYAFNKNVVFQEPVQVPVDNFGNPLLQQPNGSTLSINPKTIPVTPARTDKDYLLKLQERVTNGSTTAQDELVLKKNRNPLSTFNVEDNVKLETLVAERLPETASLSNVLIPEQVSMFLPELQGKTFGEAVGTPEGKLAQVDLLINQIRNEQIEENKSNARAGTAVRGGISRIDQLNEKRGAEIADLELLKKKLGTQLAKQGESEVEAVVSRDESGNLLNKFINRISIANPTTSGIAGSNIENEVIETKQNLPVEFSTGLNYLKYVEPVEYQRLTRSLKNGQPVSESQIANITAQGIEIQEQRLQDKYSANEIDRNEYVKQATELQQARYKNITENKETLRALLSEGIANYADDINVGTEGVNVNSILLKKVFGHRWNYTDEEIYQYGQAVAKAYGLNPQDANVQEALKYLADNEGAMILQNSISKSGLVRDFAKGLASPIRGISSTIEDIGKSNAQIYAEGQSQGNVNVSEKRLKRIDDSWEGVVSSVVEGAGQFATQAGISYLTSGVIGTAGKALLAEETVAGAAGNNLIGNALINTKDGLATFITAYAQSYDNHLKQAQAYTSDENDARTTAQVMAGLEGATELFLSPLEIAKGIGKNLFNPKSTRGIVNILSDAAILDKRSALKSLLKGTLATAKVLGSEIGEEEVVQIADYVANSYLNPDSQSFQNRDLLNEVVATANQTGLSMAIPALLSGIGAGKANTFSKGTLLIAAQNRQSIVDDMNKRLADGRLTQDQYDEKTQIVNTAQNANDQVPQRSDGATLSSSQKADYVFSRVTESVLRKKSENSKDEAEKQVLDEKIKAEQNFRVNILKVTDNENEIQPQQVPESDNATGANISNNNQTQVAENAKGKNTEVVLEDKNIVPAFNNIKLVIPEGDLPATENIIQRVNNAENINENEINSAQNVLYDALDKNPQAAHLIEPLILKLQDYGFTTKTETGTATEAVPVEGAFTNKRAIEIKPALEQSTGSNATVTQKDGNTSTGTLNVKGGQYVLDVKGGNQIIIGEKAITDRDLKLPSEDRVDNPIELDTDGNVKSVTFETRNGNLVTINNPEKALDIAIQLQSESIGKVPDAVFEQVYTEVEKTVSREVPAKNAESVSIPSKEPLNNEKKNTETPTVKATLANVIGGTLGNQGLSMMEANTRNGGPFKINNINKATSEQIEKIKNDFERLKELHPERNLELIEEGNSITIKPNENKKTATVVGSESNVTINKKDGTVTKETLLKRYYNSPDYFIENVGLYNSIFPESKIEIKGLSKNSEGKWEAKVEQPYIEGTEPTREEIYQVMADKGFEKLDAFTFKKGDITIRDVNTENVIKGKDGKLYFIDTQVKKDLGYERIEDVAARTEAGKPVNFDAYRIEQSPEINAETGVFVSDSGFVDLLKHRTDKGWKWYKFHGDKNQYSVKLQKPYKATSKYELLKSLNTKEGNQIIEKYKEKDDFDHPEADKIILKELKKQGFDGVVYSEDREAQIFNKKSLTKIEDAENKKTTTNKANENTSTGSNTRGITETKATQTETNKSQSAKSLADKIRALKSKPGAAYDSILGIPIAIYDGALSIVANAVEGGVALANAIKKGIEYIRSKGVEFDEQQYSDHLNIRGIEGLDNIKKYVQDITDKRLNDLANKNKLPIAKVLSDFYNWVRNGVSDFVDLVYDYAKIITIGLGLSTSAYVYNAAQTEHVKSPQSVSESIIDSTDEKTVVNIINQYYSENVEEAPKEVIDRAVYLWKIFGEPVILGDSTSKDDRAYATRDDAIYLGNITNFDEFVAELAHAAQFTSDAKLDDRNVGKEYKDQAQYDSIEYKRKGSVEYEAHRFIQQIIADFILKGRNVEENGFFDSDEIGEAKEISKKYSLADKIRRFKTMPRTYESLLGIPVALWDGSIELIAKAVEAGETLAEAIQKGIDYLKANNVKFDEDEYRAQIEGTNTEIDPQEIKDLAARIKSDKVKYADAIENKTDEFISALNAALENKKTSFDEQSFKSNIRRQKEYGLSKQDIIEGLNSVKKLTKNQLGLVDEVFGETEENDKAIEDLKEAFKQLAQGQKPKSVLKRLSKGNVATLVDALSQSLLSYKAISNVQLEGMADYIVDSIDLSLADDYVNAMVKNNVQDVKQLLRAKLIVALQKEGKKDLAKKLVLDMADDATAAGRQTQSLGRAYEILGAKGSPEVRAAFAQKYAESVQARATTMNKELVAMIGQKESEITRLNEQIHEKTQKSPLIKRIKDIINNLCATRLKKRK